MNRDVAMKSSTSWTGARFLRRSSSRPTAMTPNGGRSCLIWSWDRNQCGGPARSQGYVAARSSTMSCGDMVRPTAAIDAVDSQEVFQHLAEVIK